MNNNNVEITNNLEEKLLQTVLNYCKEDVAEESEINSVNKMRDVKICKKLKKIHGFLLNLLKANKVGKIDEEDLKVNIFFYVFKFVFIFNFLYLTKILWTFKSINCMIIIF